MTQLQIAVHAWVTARESNRDPGHREFAEAYGHRAPRSETHDDEVLGALA